VAAAHANLRAMIDASRGAGAQVLLVGMRMPPNYGRDYADKFFSMFGALSKEAELPLAPFMLDGVTDKLFQADRLHPLATAHPIILGNIWPHLQPLLKAK
jgi:acyl-CoA thioesterase-1